MNWFRREWFRHLRQTGNLLLLCNFFVTSFSLDERCEAVVSNIFSRKHQLWGVKMTRYSVWYVSHRTRAQSIKPFYLAVNAKINPKQMPGYRVAILHTIVINCPSHNCIVAQKNVSLSASNIYLSNDKEIQHRGAQF